MCVCLLFFAQVVFRCCFFVPVSLRAVVAFVCSCILCAVVVVVCLCLCVASVSFCDCVFLFRRCLFVFGSRCSVVIVVCLFLCVLSLSLLLGSPRRIIQSVRLVACLFVGVFAGRFVRLFDRLFYLFVLLSAHVLFSSVSFDVMAPKPGLVVTYGRMRSGMHRTFCYRHVCVLQVAVH